MAHQNCYDRRDGLSIPLPEVEVSASELHNATAPLLVLGNQATTNASANTGQNITGLSSVVGNQATVGQITTGITDIRIGGGPKKRTFKWSDEFDKILLDCATRTRESDQPFKATLYQMFKTICKEQFGLTSIGTEQSVYAQLKRLESDKPPKERQNMVWNTVNCDKLLRCGFEAMHIKERENSKSYIELMFTKFKSLVPEYNGEKDNLGNKFQKLCNKMSEPEIKALRKTIENELTAIEFENADLESNLPSNLREYQNYYNIGKTHGEKPLFKAMCFNCGKLLFGEWRENKRYTTVPLPPESEINILKYYDELPKNIPYKASATMGFKCRVCVKVPNILELVNLRNPESDTMTLPEPLQALSGTNELAQVALLGVYTSLHQRRDEYYRKFPHLQGEVNLLSKEEKAYIAMFGIMQERTPVGQTAKQRAITDRVKRAFRWLKKWNPLYKKFYANAETVFNYLFPKNPMLLNAAISYTTSKDKDLSEELGDERIGYFLPANNYEGQNDLGEDDFPVGTAHPKSNEAAVTPREEFRRLTNPSIQNPNLEAMAFPREFPGGTGSFDPKGPVKHRDYCKLTTHNWDDRFRRNPYLGFFNVDRFIKRSLMNFHRMTVGPVGPTVQSRPTVADIRNERQSVYRRYGNKVPATVPGSRSYWWNATQNVLAMTLDEGRPPDYFLTFTTNDNWPEIQRCVYHGADGSCDQCPHENDPKAAVDFATECSIAFNLRWSAWKKAVLHNKDGELGHVKRYWFRREYQKRGAVHMHGVVWIEPESKKPGVVRAEVPRGKKNDTGTKELRRLVQQYQIHKCIPTRCLMAGTKRLTKCKYGFPAPLVNDVRLDETGLRKHYRRRCDEDRYIVSYCMSMLLIFRAHTNIQEISTNGWEMYLTKYMTKPEPTTRVRYGGKMDPKSASNVERYLNMRVIGIVEVMDLLSQFPAIETNVDVIYLPIEIEATNKVLKRKTHLPKDEHSTEVYYDSKIEKYLLRPRALESVTYPDFYRNYTYRQTANDDLSEGSEDETESVASASEQPMKDAKHRTVVRRRHPIVIRFPFLLPYGEDQEQYCLKLLLEAFPFNVNTIHAIISEANTTKTYLEECAIRGLWDPEKVSLNFLNYAEKMGYSELRLREFAGQLEQYNYLCKPEVVKFFRILTEREGFQNFRHYDVEYAGVDEDDVYGKCPVPEVEVEPLEFYLKSFNAEQRRIFERIRDEIGTKNKQCLAAIVGPAGTGKSHLLKALCALCLDESCRKTFCVLAPTGSAAYLIKGRTIHSMFKFDTKYKSWALPNSMEAFFILHCDVWLFDEMSMIEDELMDAVQNSMNIHSEFHNRHKSFGGKHVILFGDPAQLPALITPFFVGDFFQTFDIYTLKQIVRQDNREFAEILRQVRVANVTKRVEDYFNRLLIKEINYKEVIENNITIIVALRSKRDKINLTILGKLPGEETVFTAIDTNMSLGALSKDQRDRLESKPEKFKTEIRLKVNALVVLRRNINTAAGQVNGRLAKVESIGEEYVMLKSLDGKEHWPVKRMKQTIQDFGGEDHYIRSQFPIDLGWAATVHRVQGFTLDKAIVMLDEDFFDSGMAYVALTRTRTPENLQLLKFAPKKIFLSKFYRELLAWMDMHDVFNENGDKSYPFPVWENPRLPKSKKADKSADNNIPLPAPKRQAVNDDEDMPSQKSQRTDEDEMIVDEQESMPAKCRRLLEEMMGIRVYADDNCEQLNGYLEQHHEFVQQVLQTLQGREPIITADLPNRNRREPRAPVPYSMRANFKEVQIPGDGNCFYYACSTALFGTNDYMTVVRFATVVSIAEHPVYFDQFAHRFGSGILEVLLSVGTLTHNEQLTRQQYPDIELEPMFSYAENVGQLATSVAIHRPIYLYGPQFTNLSPTEHMANRVPICVKLHERHFEALIPNVLDAQRELCPAFGGFVDHDNNNRPVYPLTWNG